MPANLDFYQGGNTQRGSGADNYLNAIQTGSDQQAGALDFISKVIEQSTALRQQQQMHQQEQQLKATGEDAQRRHEIAMRQMIEQGWTSRTMADLEAKAADAAAKRDYDLAEIGIKERAATERTQLEQEEKAREYDDKARREAIVSDIKAGDAYRKERAEQGRFEDTQAGLDRRNDADNARALEVARLSGQNAGNQLRVPGISSFYDNDGSISAAEYEDEISDAGNALIDAAVDQKISKDPRFKFDAPTPEEYKAERKKMMRILGKKERPAAPTVPAPTPSAKPTGGLEDLNSKTDGTLFSGMGEQKDAFLDDLIRALDRRDENGINQVYGKYGVKPGSGEIEALDQRRSGTGPAASTEARAQRQQLGKPQAAQEPVKSRGQLRAEEELAKATEASTRYQARELANLGFKEDPLKSPESLYRALSFLQSKGILDSSWRAKDPEDRGFESLYYHGKRLGWLK